MTNKTRIFFTMAALGAAIFAVFTAVHTLTGGVWALSVPAAVGTAFAARSVYRRLLGRMANDSVAVPTIHGPNGRIEAIEVFWRPG
ncbi:MAG: hypothetical protein AAGA99_20110 [Actinomycetota bacterium]